MRFLILNALIAAAMFASDAARPPSSRKTLTAPAEFQGYACAAGYAWFYDAGGLCSCAVAKESQFGEARVPEGSRVHLTPDGRTNFVFLSRDWTIRGLACRGGGHDYMTTFYPSGKLKLCWLAEDREVNGVPCGRASFLADVFGGGAGTWFHENGGLRTCRLSKAAVIQGARFSSGEHVVLDPDGKLAPARQK